MLKYIEMIGIQMPNGDIVIGCNGENENREFFVKTSDGIIKYSENEMDKIYGLVPNDTHLLAVEI